MAYSQSSRPSNIETIKKLLDNLTEKAPKPSPTEQIEATRLIEQMEVFKKNHLTTKKI